MLTYVKALVVQHHSQIGGDECESTQTTQDNANFVADPRQTQRVVQSVTAVTSKLLTLPGPKSVRMHASDEHTIG